MIILKLLLFRIDFILYYKSGHLNARSDKWRSFVHRQPMQNLIEGNFFNWY